MEPEKFVGKAGKTYMESQTDSKINIIIVGAGKAGELIAKDINKSDETPFSIAGYVDDDPDKQGKIISGIQVRGTIEDLNKLIPDLNVQELFIAIPSERGKAIRRVIECSMGSGVVYKILPRLSEVLLQDFEQDYLKYIRRVKAEDLLGGEILKSDQHEIDKFAEGQTILITGAAGSIGSELSRQIAAYGTKKVVLYDWWENGIFDLGNQLKEMNPDRDIEYIIGDIKDRKKIDQVMRMYQPTTVFHAAAYKHVPLMEHNPSEAIKNNILGTRTVAEIAIKYKVKKFVMVSTDKAVNPTNIMGATKRAAEKVIHILSQSQSDTIFCAVRFGNVINSNGSAIPIFEKQIEKGGPLTVTHKEITRFFMTIPEAVHLILQTWVMGENNDLFVLEMGEPIKIYELAKLLIALQGYVPEKDIHIKIVGLRPGEKLYEEVLVKEEETQATPIKKIHKTKNYMSFDKFAFLNNLSLLLESLEDESFNIQGIKERMKMMISTYRPKD
jgi:FlaA1/EpsC-like NDP-sugar epimerase